MPKATINLAVFKRILRFVEVDLTTQLDLHVVEGFELPDLVTHTKVSGVSLVSRVECLADGFFTVSGRYGEIAGAIVGGRTLDRTVVLSVESDEQFVNGRPVDRLVPLQKDFYDPGAVRLYVRERTFRRIYKEFTEQVKNTRWPRIKDPAHRVVRVTIDGERSTLEALDRAKGEVYGVVSIARALDSSDGCGIIDVPAWVMRRIVDRGFYTGFTFLTDGTMHRVSTGSCGVYWS